MLAKGAQWVSVSLSLRVFIALGTVSIQRYRPTSIRNSLCLHNGNPCPERLCSYRDMVLVATATVAMNLLQASCNVKHSCYILAYQLPSWNMMTSSNGNILRVTGPVCGEFTGPGEFPMMFSLICVWINDWVNNREAGDLRRHRGDYDVNVMISSLFISCGILCGKVGSGNLMVYPLAYGVHNTFA